MLRRRRRRRDCGIGPVRGVLGLQSDLTSVAHVVILDTVSIVKTIHIRCWCSDKSLALALAYVLGDLYGSSRGEKILLLCMVFGKLRLSVEIVSKACDALAGENTEYGTLMVGEI